MKKNTIEKSTKQQKTDHSIQGTGIYSLNKIIETAYTEANRIALKARKDNPSKPNIKEYIAISECTKAILNNQYLKEQYDNHLNKMIAEIQKECQDAYTTINEHLDEEVKEFGKIITKD